MRSAGYRWNHRWPPLLLRARVPGDGQALVAAAGKRHQVLLQRHEAERVGDLVVVKLAVRAVGPHEELAVPLRERRRDARVRERGAVEVAQHGGVGGDLHRAGVVRLAPLFRLRLVAWRAGRLADVGGRRGRRRDRRGYGDSRGVVSGVALPEIGAGRDPAERYGDGGEEGSSGQSGHALHPKPASPRRDRKSGARRGSRLTAGVDWIHTQYGRTPRGGQRNGLRSHPRT